MSDLEIELNCFREFHSGKKASVGRAAHCKNIIRMLWPENGPKPFIFHPWAEEMIEAMCEEKYLGITGCANSCKSSTSAVFAIVKWLSDPEHSTILITSTSISAARQRIWGYIEEFWNTLVQTGIRLPGKMVASGPMIRFEHPVTGQSSSKHGIFLVACEPKQDKKAIGKLVGFKAGYVAGGRMGSMVLVGDEFCELSCALLEAAMSNLSANCNFQLFALGNFASIYDPLGIICTPKIGWGAISPDTGGWDTELGRCLHFDAERSPNILANKTIYPFLPTKKWIEAQAKELGENSYGYWRMVKGFPAPEGATDGLYSDADYIICDAGRKDIRWISKPTPIAGLDLSFTDGGDGCCAVFCEFGVSEDFGQTLLVKGWEFYSEDRRAKKRRSRQIAEAFRADCEARGIRPEHAGYDSSGTGGKAMGDTIAEVWSGSCYACDFSGAPSEIPTGVKDKETGKNRFYNRVSELWGVGVDYLRSEQLKGIVDALAKQMAARKVKTHHKRGDDLLMQIEPKKEMRKRTNGQSPDVADAFFIALDVARARLKFRPNVSKIADKAAQAKWNKFVQQQEAPARTVHSIAKTALEAQTQAKKRGWAHRVLQVQGSGWGNKSLLR